MRRTIHFMTTGLLLLASITIMTRFQPERVLALDETLTTCDWETFSATLDAVQDDGGGMITLDCSETIVFEGGKTITTDVTISGDGAVFDGDGTTRLFRVNEGAALKLIGLTLQNGDAGADSGGAIFNDGTLTIKDSTISDSRAEIGGGIYSSLDDSVTLTNSTVRDNVAHRFAGGGIASFGDLTLTNSTVGGNTAFSDGGGIFNDFSSTITLTNSTISGNTAFNGGGIFNAFGGVLILTNGTISGNMAGASGGGISSDHGNVTLTNSTISDNAADSGGGVFNDSGSFTFQNTIVANSTNGGNCSGGGYTSFDFNLTDRNGCGMTQPNDFQNTPADLGQLADNGGPTQTHLPLPDSLAIDNAQSAHCPAEDQRGVSRPRGNGCDIGAVEAPVPTLNTPVVSPSPSDEGDEVTVSTTFLDEFSDSQTCTVDYGDGSPTQAGTFDDDACTGPPHTFADGDETFTFTVEVCNNDGYCTSSSVEHNVSNVAPTIDSITTNAPISQGQPVSVTVEASDPGGPPSGPDVLSYRFDCDDDGEFEIGPQAGNTADCPLDPVAASTTINVLVEDGDGGSDTGSIMVRQTLTLCGSYYTGVVSLPVAGQCPNGTAELRLPGELPTTLCINPYTGQMSWSPSGSCPGVAWPHVIPDDGPLHYCENLWTGHMRYAPTGTGQCSAAEIPGSIPG